MCVSCDAHKFVIVGVPVAGQPPAQGLLNRLATFIHALDVAFAGNTDARHTQVGPETICKPEHRGEVQEFIADDEFPCDAGVTTPEHRDELRWALPDPSTLVYFDIQTMHNRSAQFLRDAFRADLASDHRTDFRVTLSDYKFGVELVCGGFGDFTGDADTPQIPDRPPIAEFYRRPAIVV